MKIITSFWFPDLELFKVLALLELFFEFLELSTSGTGGAGAGCSFAVELLEGLELEFLETGGAGTGGVGSSGAGLGGARTGGAVELLQGFETLEPLDPIVDVSFLLFDGTFVKPPLPPPFLILS
jgi:hypothetical protein